MGKPEVIVAFDGPNGLSIRQDGFKFGVFLAGEKVDWFDDIQDARKLTQDLSISRVASANDTLIGQTKYCGDSLTNGRLVVVVAKIQKGYVVQTQGKPQDRFEVTADELTDPPNYF